MVSTFTPNLNLEIPARGDYPNQWDLPMDATLSSIDSAYGSTLSLTGQTGGTVVLTRAQANNKIISVTGSLTSNLIIAFPPIGGGEKWIIPAATLSTRPNRRCATGGSRKAAIGPPAAPIIATQPTEPSMRASSSTTRTCVMGSSSPPP